jgi:hypothetical protein
VSSPAIIVDLDGTLALIGNRSPYDADECGLDVVNEAVRTVMGWAQTAGYAIVLVSGRGLKASHRTRTEQWLTWNGIHWDELHMRRPGDQRPDDVVKAEIYRDRIEDNHTVLFVLDDRAAVVRMWREQFGLTVFQVADRI